MVNPQHSGQASPGAFLLVCYGSGGSLSDVWDGCQMEIWCFGTGKMIICYSYRLNSEGGIDKSCVILVVRAASHALTLKCSVLNALVEGGQKPLPGPCP